MKFATKKEIKLLSIFSTCFFISLTNVGYCSFAKEKGNLKNIENKIHKEIVKEKCHDEMDLINHKKIHEMVHGADSIDADKLKESVDEIASYFDKEKIKKYSDCTADHLDKEKIKEMIDLAAETLDREKIKAALDQAIASLDKEQIKETVDKSVDQMVASLEDIVGNLEDDIRHSWNNKKGIEEAINHYNWKHWFSSGTSYGPATLKNLRFNNTGQAITVVKRGETIEGDVDCSFDRNQCSSLGLYRVVLGLKNQGGQAAIFNHFGLRAGNETDHFTLTAPRGRGVYQVSFRVVEAVREKTAIKSWDDLENVEVCNPPTIGLLIVI